MTAPGGILLGAGGHALVVLHLARAAGLPVTAVTDPALAAQGIATWQGLTCLGGDEALTPPTAPLLNGIGILPGSTLRATLQTRLAARGWAFPPLTHPAAWVAPGTPLGAGAQIMAGAIVQPGGQIGPGTIVNTRASIDHDAQIGAFCHIAPGATLCGTVTLGDGVFVGAGATLTQGITIGSGAVIAAGAVVVHDVAQGETTFGRYEQRAKR